MIWNYGFNNYILNILPLKCFLYWTYSLECYYLFYFQIKGFTQQLYIKLLPVGPFKSETDFGDPLSWKLLLGLAKYIEACILNIYLHLETYQLLCRLSQRLIQNMEKLGLLSRLWSDEEDSVPYYLKCIPKKKSE